MIKLKDIRDCAITGSYLIGNEKEPLDWKFYANRLEQILINNDGVLPFVKNIERECKTTEIKSESVFTCETCDGKYKTVNDNGSLTVYRNGTNEVWMKDELIGNGYVLSLVQEIENLKTIIEFMKVMINDDPLSQENLQKLIKKRGS